MEIRTREVTAALWPDVESLFGARGACRRCWCWYWRLAKGESWDAVKGEPARRRLRQGIATVSEARAARTSSDAAENGAAICCFESRCRLSSG